MQVLPSIDVLGFLNWMNAEGYPNLQTNILLDELFLDRVSNQDTVHALAREYLTHRRFYDLRSNEYIASEYIDAFLSIFRSDAIAQLKQHRVDLEDFGDLSYILRDSFYHTLDSMEKVSKSSTNLHDCTISQLFSRRQHYRAKHDVTAEELVDSVYFYLAHHIDPMIAAIISGASNSIANCTCSFLHYLKEHGRIKNMDFHNIPTDIMEKIIDKYMWVTYRKSSCSEPHHVHAILNQVFIEHKYDDYLGEILPYTKFSQVVKRFFNRQVRYKCTLLSDDESIAQFVSENWQELNDYSGDYLDIYYNEQELLKKGYQTAEKLDIRSRVTSYPSLYLWEYDLKAGHAISIGNLTERELLDFFKGVIDQIAKHENLMSIANFAADLVEKIQTARAVRSNEEMKLTRLILNACHELQNQRIWFQKEGKLENARNTYIAHLLNRDAFFAKDQTLGGQSSTGISIGENDIKIYRNQTEPFAIIEALNQSAQHARDWHHKKFHEHVNRIYNYDTSGLARNYLLLYADTPMFDDYWKSILHEFELTNKCKFGSAQFIDVTDLEDLSQTDLRIGVVRYRRNGRIVKLYVISVLMDSGTPIPQNTTDA